MFVIDDPLEGDWPAILRVADASAPTKADANQNWLDNRRAVTGRKYHYVGRDEERRVRGFGALEETSAGWFRLFIVVAPTDLETVGDALYKRLESDVSRHAVLGLWAREEPVDADLVAFLARRGFAAAEPETLPSGETVIVATKPLT